MNILRFLMLLSLLVVAFLGGGYFPASTVKKELVNQGVAQEQKRATANQCIEKLRGKVRILQESEIGISPTSFDATYLPEIDGIDGYRPKDVSFFEFREFVHVLAP